MRLSDSDDDTVATERGEQTPAELERSPVETGHRSPDRSALGPVEFVDRVGGYLEDDPDAAANAIGDLLAIARDEEGAARVAAGEALDAIGRRQPSAFEVWTEPVVAAARSGDEDVSFFGLRALAQLAGANPRAAGKGLDVALGSLGSASPDIRQAAISVLAEVGPVDPDAVKRADRPLAEALRAGDENVRTAAAIAAGRLLGAAPNKFPRTATALLDVLDDEAARPREFAHVALANFAREHPDNVPQKARALSALAGVTDDELGLRRGTVGEAMTALVSLEFEEDAAAG